MPDFGVQISKDNDENNRIYIFEGISPNMYKDETYSKSGFIVDGSKKDDLYEKDEGDYMYKLVAFNKDEN